MTNLQQKYELMHGKSAVDMNVEFIPDMNYIRRREQSGKRLTKKITIKEGDEARSTDLIAFEMPFLLRGDSALMEIAYEAGIGEKNSLGFGMIEVVAAT